MLTIEIPMELIGKITYVAIVFLPAIVYSLYKKLRS